MDLSPRISLRPKGIADSSAALGQCLIQSKGYAKKNKLGLIRVTGYNYPRREHWAIYDGTSSTLGQGRVIDLTARQFVDTVPARYETECLEWVASACGWLNDSLTYEIYLTHDSQLTPDYLGKVMEGKQ